MLDKLKEVAKSEEKFDKEFAASLKDANTQKIYVVLVAIAKIVASVTFAINLKNVLLYGLPSLLP